MNQTVYFRILQMLLILGMINPLEAKLVRPSQNGEEKEILIIGGKRRLYYPIKDFLTMILLTNDLILINTNDNKNNLFTNILKHSFKIYNIINSGVENVDFIDNYKKEYFKFIEICKKNIKIINSI